MIVKTAIPIQYLIGKIWQDLLFIFLLSLSIHFFSEIFSARIPEMPLHVPAFLGTAISVLLSFKISQSYDRWWEARKIWGAIVNDSRSLTLQLQQFTGGHAMDAVKQMVYRQIAWCYILGQSLRGLNALDNTDGLLERPDREALMQHINKPLALLQLNAQSLKELRRAEKIDAFSHIQIDSTLVRLCDAMGKAERIKGTVFPVTYRLFLHFAIYVFVIVLSVALKDVNVFFELPLLLLISSIFFLLEKSAFHLQDPFQNRPSDVSVTAIARTIEINCRQLLGETDVPKPIGPKKFYLM